MAPRVLFEWVCGELERATALDRLQARGTVRLALKQAGLDVASLTPEQLAVVLERLLPRELRARGVPDGSGVCRELARRAADLDPGESAPAPAPEDVFRRLADNSPED